ELAHQILSILETQVGPGIGIPIVNLRERLRQATGTGRKTDHVVAARKLLLDEGEIVLDARGRVMLPVPRIPLTGNAGNAASQCLPPPADGLEATIRRHSNGADVLWHGGRP